MRPLRLTMKAFGSYAEETAVDFESLSGGLYLIVGRTGAGKTTIFDAISFALFGAPSGSVRTSAMLHSDYVPLSEDAAVTLDFRHQGRAWHVERSLHFRKKRTGGYDDTPTVSASMTGEDGSALEGAQRVTARCEELLGLTAEQFRRIVMLAQGEFQEFLRSNSDGKNEILGRLFDNSAYVRYRDLLRNTRELLHGKRQALEEEIVLVMQTLFRLPEGADAAAYLPGDPELPERLRALTAADEAAFARAQEKDAQSRAALEALTRRETLASAEEKLFAELDEQRLRLAALEKQAAEKAAQRSAAEAADRALHAVVPRAETRRRASEALQQTRGRLETEEKRYADGLAALEKAQRTVEADGPLRAEAENAAAEEARLRPLLPRYDELAENRKLCAQTEAQLAREEKNAAALETKQTALSAALEKAQSELLGLEGCEAEAVRLRGVCDAARQRLEEADAPDVGLAANVAALQREAGALDAQSAVLQRLTEEAAAAEAARHALYQAYLAGQAGVLASELERTLTETGEALCPVCGARWHAGEKHSFALRGGEVPAQEDVEAAEAAAKEKERARQKLYAETEKRRGVLEQSRSSTAARAARLDPALGSWGALTAPGALGALTARLRAEQEKAEAALAGAQARCARRETLLREEKKNAEALSQLAEQRETLRARLEQLRQEQHGLHAAGAELARQLPFPERKEADARLQALAARRKELLRTAEAHERALAGAKAVCDGTAGALETLRASLPEREAEYTSAERELEKALAGAGFGALSAAEAALAPIGGGDGEKWLAAQRQALEEYARALAAARERIAALEKQTAARERPDVEALHAALEAARAEAEATAAEAAARGEELKGHRTVQERVSAACEALRGSDRAWQRLDRLAELAVGASGDGGRLSFDRYVMGAIFREVLEMANRRLDVMTGGRLELIHSVEAGRRNAAAGLEIEVLDVALDKRRASGSISGGESFMVSLALALGLSDVVQNHAGGQRLETLFIDEGFGSLDDGRLDSVISVLQQLTEGDRLVGIISHVEKLEESIPQKLRVTNGPKGSSLRLELS